jgi:hypothetical protein
MLKNVRRKHSIYKKEKRRRGEKKETVNPY